MIAYEFYWRYVNAVEMNSASDWTVTVHAICANANEDKCRVGSMDLPHKH